MAISRTDFLNRARKYCADKEKCAFDVIQKMKEWNVPEDDQEEILKMLQEEKFLNEERYAKSFVEEKWITDQWGRIKIEHALQQKNISEHFIKEAMAGIDERQYNEGLHDLLLKKYREVKTVSTADDAKRVMMFGTSRGFEEELISEWIEENIFR